MAAQVLAAAARFGEADSPFAAIGQDEPGVARKRRQVRALRLARSVADLATSGGVAREHVAEALALVPRSRGIG